MTKEQIKEQLEVGDYTNAAKMLKTTRENTRVRFGRNKKDVLEVLTIIINNRKELIRQYREGLIVN